MLLGSTSQEVLTQLRETLDKNLGYGQVQKISNILNGTQQENLDIKLTPNQICSFIYAPVVTCDVERSFSRFKIKG